MRARRPCCAGSTPADRPRAQEWVRCQRAGEQTAIKTGSSPSMPSGASPSTHAMNRYGTQAMRHWQQTDPDRYQQIPDPETFFTELGERVESEIQALATAIAGPDRPGETYME